MAVTRTMLLKLQADASQYTKTMQQATKEQQIIKKELSLWSEQTKKAAGSAAYLKKELEAQKQQQQLLQLQVKRTTEELSSQSKKYGEDSKQAQNLRARLLDLQTAQEKLNNSIKNQPNRIWAARGESIKNAGTNIKNAGMGMTYGVTAPIVAGAVGISKLAMDVIESENLFRVSMGNMTGDAIIFSNSISKSMGLNSNEVRKNIGTFNVMLGSMDISEKKAYDMSKSLTQLAYDIASFYNLSNEDAFEKLRSGITGEVKPLKDIGIIINETAVKNYALTHGLIKQGEQLSEAGKVVARYGAIMEATNKAQGDLVRTADSPANQLRRLQNQATETATELGRSLIPTLTALLKFLNESVIPAIKNVTEYFNRMPTGTKNAILGIVGITATIGPMLVAIGYATIGLGGLVTIVPKVAVVFSGLIQILSAVRAGFIAAAAGEATFGAAFMAAMGPAGWITLGVIALGALTYALIKNRNAQDQIKSLSDVYLNDVGPINSQTAAVSGLVKAKYDLIQANAALAGGNINTLQNQWNNVDYAVSILDKMRNGNINQYEADWLRKNQADAYSSIVSQRGRVGPMGDKLSPEKANTAYAEMLKKRSELYGQLSQNWKAKQDWETLQKGGTLNAGAKIPTVGDITPSYIADDTNTAKSSADKMANAIENVRDAVSSYMDKIKQATDSTQNFVGMFDRFAQKTVSLARIIRNMATNRDVMINWQGNITKLQSAGLNNEFLKELIQKGPSGYNEIKALAKASPEQIAQLNSLWADQRWNAGNIAKMQLGGEAVVTRQTVNQTIKIDVYGNEIKEDMDINSIADRIVEALRRRGVLTTS